MALSGNAGLQILDPWCHGFQSALKREKRWYQNGNKLLAERKKYSKRGEKDAWLEESGEEGMTQLESARTHALCSSHCTVAL